VRVFFEIFFLESIELIEIYLEPVRPELEPVVRRILDGFTEILSVFVVPDGLGEFGGGVLGKIMCGIDRARRDLFGTSEIRVGTSRGTNPR
jgi:hypothetical protein